MQSRERFFSAMAYEGYDRMPTHYYGTPEINQRLMAHFGAADMAGVLDVLDTDFRSVMPAYQGPELRTFPDGSYEGIWGEHYKHVPFRDGSGTYPEACYLPYAQVEDAAQLENFRFPSADWYDYSTIGDQCARHQGRVRILGGAGDPDFINGISRGRGMEQVLMDIATEDPVLLGLMRRRFDYVLERNRRVLEAAGGGIDIVAFGEDLGNQRGLLISPQAYTKLFAPYMKTLFDQAHAYGARTMMHSCGSVYHLIPTLIELGLDILEVVQTDAENMDIERLHDEFYGRIAFCGSMSVQSVLPFGSVQEVREAVRLRQRLFARGGMIIAPSHALQVDTPLENILAMYEEIGSLRS